MSRKPIESPTLRVGERVTSYIHVIVGRRLFDTVFFDDFDPLAVERAIEAAAGLRRSAQEVFGKADGRPRLVVYRPPACGAPLDCAVVGASLEFN